MRGHDIFPRDEKHISDLESLLLMNEENIPGPGIFLGDIHVNKEGGYWEYFFNNLPEGVILVSENCLVCRVNIKFCEIFGYDPEELVGQYLPETIAGGTSALEEEIRSVIRKACSGSGTLLETFRSKKDGTLVPVSIMAMPLAKGIDGAAAYAIYRDMSNIMETRRSLKARLSFESLISDVASILISSENIDFNISQSLKEICRFFRADCSFLFVFDRNMTTMWNTHEYFSGLSHRNISGLTKYDVSGIPWFIEKLLSDGQFLVEDTSMIPEEGALEKATLQSKGILSLIDIPFFVGEKPGGFVSVVNFDKVAFWKERDVADLKLYCNLLGAVVFRMQIQDELRNSEQFNSCLIENSPNVVVVMQPDTTITYVSPPFGAMTGYDSSEVIGRKAPFPWWTTSRTMDDLLKNLREAHIRDELCFRRKDGELFWVLFSMNPVYRDGTLQFYQSIWVDITQRKKAENDLDISNKLLLRNVEDMVTLLGKTIEVGDPYTGGHQRNVSKLAVAIAREMDFPEERVAIIKYAALVHDVGKIKIPSSILIKPGKITDMEREMIKTHPYYGREILKTVNFPWPISEMIYEHHERLDGSGYPRGLKGEDIMTEARILAVADVVEAMFAYRPYRPGLGMQRTLREIRENRGILYDEKVVDACLVLFEEKGFVFDKVMDFPS